ncbi:MAG: M23 family metallopeptidase [Oscillibacter sp.]|jgi:murein DD-endopeptidase MepM/ murein hydrolase activator NlpD|nr:M23 family metallopeptidase [Oscillibacter sp.]
MTQKPKRLLRGTGRYVLAAVGCLAVVVAGTWFLLNRSDTGAQTEATQSVEASAPVSVPEKAPEEKTVPTAKKVEMPEIPVETVETVDPTPVEAEAPSLTVSPLSGDVVAAFSVDQLQYSATLDDWRTHDGIDIAAAQGTKVLAASAGTVLSVTDDELMGTTVVLSHNDGYQTTYANLQAQPGVKKGDKVSAGQTIGTVGTTSLAESAEGPHLHFSVTKDGDAVDPQKYLKS